MFKLVLSLILLQIARPEPYIFDAYPSCSCEHHTSQSQCNVRCSWNVQTGICEAPNSDACDEIEDMQTCEGVESCDWDVNHCSAYEGCTQQNQDLYTCIMKPACDIVSVGDTYFTCGEYDHGHDCSSMTESECWPDKNNFCHWTGIACTELTKCEDAKEVPEYCDLETCVLSEDDCVQKNFCKDISNEEDCTAVQVYYSKYQLCRWIGSCQDAENTAHLSEQTCMKGTLNTHQWEDGKCTPCDFRNFSKLLIIPLVVFITFL